MEKTRLKHDHHRIAVHNDIKDTISLYCKKTLKLFVSLCVLGSIYRYIWDSYEAAGIKVHKDLYPTAVSESKDQLCACVLSYFIFKSIQWFTVTTWIPDRYHIPCITLHVKTTRNQRNQHVVSKFSTRYQPSCKNYWWGTIQRAKPNGSQDIRISVVKRRVRLHMVS